MCDLLRRERGGARRGPGRGRGPHGIMYKLDGDKARFNLPGRMTGAFKAELRGATMNKVRAGPCWAGRPPHRCRGAWPPAPGHPPPAPAAAAQGRRAPHLGFWEPIGGLVCQAANNIPRREWGGAWAPPRLGAKRDTSAPQNHLNTHPRQHLNTPAPARRLLRAGEQAGLPRPGPRRARPQPVPLRGGDLGHLGAHDVGGFSSGNTLGGTSRVEQTLHHLYLRGKLAGPGRGAGDHI